MPGLYLSRVALSDPELERDPGGWRTLGAAGDVP
jgi:hypothetical protein